jgi:hypothetical protein
MEWLADALSKWVPVIGIIGGGLWAVFVLRKDLKWRRADKAKTLNDEMLEDPAAFAAMEFVDDDFEVLRKGSKSYTIGAAEVPRALAFNPVDDSEPARVLRECFDAWLYYLGLIQHYNERGLIDVADLEYRRSTTLASFAVTRKFGRRARSMCAITTLAERPWTTCVKSNRYQGRTGPGAVELRPERSDRGSAGRVPRGSRATRARATP